MYYHSCAGGTQLACRPSCAGVECGGRGACDPDPAGWAGVCNCTGGLSGVHCAVHGSCSSRRRRTSCSCTGGHTGTRCTVEPGVQNSHGCIECARTGGVENAKQELQGRRADGQTRRRGADGQMDIQTDTKTERTRTPQTTRQYPAQSLAHSRALLDRRPMLRRPLRRQRSLLRRRLHLRVPGLHRRPLPGVW